MIRQRDSLLQALEAFREVHPASSAIHILAYLYICENEGLNVSELADLCQTTCATASRTAHALARGRRAADGALTPPLVHIRPNPSDAKGRLIHLTDAGARLRDRFEAVIAAGVAIRSPAMRAA